MRRSELYDKVWNKPMTRLARELGISDVGLAKACRRHSVPVPPRGYWAKLQAGQNPPKTPLPAPELDVAVDFATTDPEERARQQTAAQQRKEAIKACTDQTVSAVEVVVLERLEKPHPLVAATERYCEKVPRLIERYKRRGMDAWSLTRDEDRPPFEQHGRYNFFREGQLDITASLDLMDWALRFHDAVFKALIAGGMKIQWCAAQAARGSHQQPVPACTQLSQSGETFSASFSQGYRRLAVEPAELAKRRKTEPWVRDFEYRPSEKLVFRVTGSEYGTRKAWEGPQDKLQQRVAEIVRSILELVPLQAQLRAEREAAAEVARRRQMVAALQRRRQEARSAQLKLAFQLADEARQVVELTAFLDHLEGKLATMPEVSRERCQVWLQVVRDELARANPVEQLLSTALTVPSWSRWPPEWWPEPGSGES